MKEESDSIPGGEVIRDSDGNVRLIAGANAHLRTFMPRPEHSTENVLASLSNVHRHYNQVGITSIFERAGSIDDFLLYRKLRADGKLTVRMTQTFRASFRSAEDVAAYTARLGMKTGDGDVYGEHQRISRMDALRCLTTTPAYLAMEEKTKGCIEEGKLADLVILDRDYLTCPEDQIAEIEVVKTMIDGRFVYDAEE